MKCFLHKLYDQVLVDDDWHLFYLVYNLNNRLSGIAIYSAPVRVLRESIHTGHPSTTYGDQLSQPLTTIDTKNFHVCKIFDHSHGFFSQFWFPIFAYVKSPLDILWLYLIELHDSTCVAVMMYSPTHIHHQRWDQSRFVTGTFDRYTICCCAHHATKMLVLTINLRIMCIWVPNLSQKTR